MEPAISDSIALDVDFQDLDSHHGLGAIIEAIYAEGDDDGREKRASVHVPLVGCTDDDRASHVMLINSLQPSHNVGYKMLMKMGWNSGVGLGKNGQGRVEPIPVIQKADHTGVGKDSQMNEAHVASTANRKQLQSEVIAGETEQEKLTREIRVLQRESIKEEIKSVIAAFYCEICDKQYTKISDYETHLSSYDHHHRKRFKEMQDMQKRGTGHLEKKRARVDKEKEREEREMKRMRDAAMARSNKGSIGAALPEPPPAVAATTPISANCTLATGAAPRWSSYGAPPPPPSGSAPPPPAPSNVQPSQPPPPPPPGDKPKVAFSFGTKSTSKIAFSLKRK